MKLTVLSCGLLAALSLTAACASKGNFQGKLVDATTGAPRANERVLAKATGGTDTACLSLEATTDAQGAFTINETCAELTYQLETADKTLSLDAPVSFTGGTPAAGSQDVKVWRAPRAEGVYLIADDKITELTKAADVFWEPVFPDPAKPDAYEKALYASTLPDPMTKVPAGGFLAISGADNLANLKVMPLIEHGPGVEFPHPESGRSATVSGASWVGLTFKADKITTTADVEHVDAKLDASKVKELKGETWATRIMPADAFAIGQYAILADGDSRMYMVAVGDGPPRPPGSILQEGTGAITPGGPENLMKKGELNAAEKEMKEGAGRPGKKKANGGK